MQVYPYLYKKINEQMRIVYITETKPKKIIRLDALDPQNLNIDLAAVGRWSQNNRQLYDLLINNGMAEFICNRQFLNQYYTHLQFMYSNIVAIDAPVLKIANLKILNLFHNNITTIQHIPNSCKQLYLDFNQVDTILIKNNLALELLSISHNKIDDNAAIQLLNKVPALRCLNVAYNRIADIRKFVNSIKTNCRKIKILISRNNPISILPLYWQFITNQIALDYFDNQKYVKPQPLKPKQQPKQQKKQEKKDQKKDAKKDTKKGGKPQQKPIEEQKKVQVKVQVPKVLKEQDFIQVKIKIQINVLENVTGIIYDASIFPQQNLNIKQTQTCFWVESEFMEKKISTQQYKISMDSIIPDGQINRIALQSNPYYKFDANYENLLKLNQGLKILVYKQEPQVETDAQTGEQKVKLDEQKQIKMKTECIGGTFIDLQQLLAMKKKYLSKNANLFEKQAVVQPLFRKPYQNQNELIAKNRVQFDAKLAALQQQKRKKQQQQQASKAQKKGGKDNKKAPAKKQTKKDSKQPQGQKKAVQKCNYPADSQQYRYLGEQKMFKCLKQKLGVKVEIE